MVLFPYHEQAMMLQMDNGMTAESLPKLPVQMKIECT